MTLPPLTYLSVDSVSHGIGLSQVARYVERLAARGVDVTLHSFEQEAVDPALAERFAHAGVRWRAHPFGRPGSSGGVGRVVRGAALVARAEFVHARSDLAAASSMLSRRRTWIWDLRGFWREQRMAQDLMRPGSATERLMQRVERSAARSSSGIVTLTRAAIDVLRERYGEEVAAKSRVVTTCVDLDLFSLSPMPPAPPVRLLLAGTLNALYDVPTMLRLTERIRERCPAELTVLRAQAGPWDESFSSFGIVPRKAAAREMPSEVAAHHVGLSVLRDVGISNRGATPTKLGEFLACGRPVVVNAGLGDMDRFVAEFACGVVVHDRSSEGLDRATDELVRLIEDPETPARCRAVAERHFDLERGVDELLAVYERAVQ